MGRNDKKTLDEIAHRRAESANKRFLWACDYFEVTPDLVERTIYSQPPTHWAEVFGGGQKGSRAAHFMALCVAGRCCAQGNHDEEERLGLAAIREIVTDEPPSYYNAWHVTLTAVVHQIEEASLFDRQSLSKHLYELSSEAIRDLDVRFAAPGRVGPSERHELDSIVSFLKRAEHFLGTPLSALSVDLERRERSREIRGRAGNAQPFFDKHREGIVRLWHEQREYWFRKRYEAKTGQPAPEKFMIKSRHTPSGWQIREEIRRIFTPDDHRDFRADMEVLYRKRLGLPAKGEGWVSETYLARCVEEVLPHHKLIREARLEWLGHQRLDIFIPDLKLAIEYQGEQHYLPLDHWGGDQGLKDRQAMDQAKRVACRKAGITLIEWSYKVPIVVESVREILKRHRIAVEV
jgi:hypothetical protein